MHLRRVIASGTSGLAATAFDVATLVLLVHRHVPIAPATFVACSVGAVVCFTLNKYIAFRDRSSVSAQQLVRFGFVAVTTALLMALAMHLCVDGLGVPYLAAKLVCSVLVFVAWGFPAQRRLVFVSARRSASLRAPAEPGLSIATARRSASLRAPAGPGLSIATARRSASLRAPAEPGLSIATARRSASLRAPAEPGLSNARSSS
jgi:putative flippase GtrA